MAGAPGSPGEGNERPIGRNGRISFDVVGHGKGHGISTVRGGHIQLRGARTLRAEYQPQIPWLVEWNVVGRARLGKVEIGKKSRLLENVPRVDAAYRPGRFTTPAPPRPTTAMRSAETAGR